jgi:branched-chain amino acid aminotransferase
MASELPGGWVLMNGVPMRPEQATVSVFDRGFLYGDSVFETMRAYRGVVLDLDAHLERLRISANALAMVLSADAATLKAEVQLGTKLAGPGDWMVRVISTRGLGPIALDPATASGGSRIVMVLPLSVPPPERYERGIVASILPKFGPGRWGVENAPKSGNYLHAVMATRTLRELGADEALFIDSEGNVVEGATSNLFWVARGSLRTPPPHPQILAGIAQRAVLECAQELGFRVELQAPSPSELLGADEVFISSSLREMLAVVAIDGAPIGQGVPGPYYRRLLDRYRQRTERCVSEEEQRAR